MSPVPVLADAACRTPENEPRFRNVTSGNLAHVRGVCGSCLDLAECREWALRREPHGFWGGLSAKERTAIRKAQGIQVMELRAGYIPGQERTPTIDGAVLNRELRMRIRAWARENGHPVRAAGLIPEHIIRAWQQATAGAS